MPGLTHSSMRDARDAEDNRLLESGEIDLLLAGWVETITGRCVAKMRGPVGHDVAQAVCERLWRELKAGRHRAGLHSDELAQLIDAFLERAPRREPTPDAIAFVRSLDEPSLLRARQAKRLKLDDLAARVVESLGLPVGARAKVRRYYQEFELGQLDPARVSEKLWVVLSDLLGPATRKLASLSPPAPMAAPMDRQADFAPDADGESSRLRDVVPIEPDEADRLFGVTPGN